MPKNVLLSAWVDEPVITVDDWVKMETAAGLTFPAAIRAGIEEAIRTYREHKAVTGPRLSAIRPIIEGIEEKAVALIAAMSAARGADPRARGAKRLFAQQGLRSRRQYQSFNTTFEAVRLLARDAQKVAERCADEDGPGPDGDPYLNDLLILLRRAFWAAGGNGLATEPIREFIKVGCCLAGARAFNSDTALMQRLKLVKDSPLLRSKQLPNAG